MVLIIGSSRHLCSSHVLHPIELQNITLANSLVQFGCVSHQTPKSKVNGSRVHFPYSSHLLSIVASTCNVSHVGTKIGSAYTHGSCAACCSRPRCRATAPIVQFNTGGASPNKKSSCSSNDPTCTSCKMLVSGRYEIDVVKRWHLSYMTRLFDVSFSRKVQSD